MLYFIVSSYIHIVFPCLPSQFSQEDVSPAAPRLWCEVWDEFLNLDLNSNLDVGVLEQAPRSRAAPTSLTSDYTDHYGTPGKGREEGGNHPKTSTAAQGVVLVFNPGEMEAGWWCVMQRRGSSCHPVILSSWMAPSIWPLDWGGSLRPTCFMRSNHHLCLWSIITTYEMMETSCRFLTTRKMIYCWLMRENTVIVVWRWICPDELHVFR